MRIRKLAPLILGITYTSASNNPPQPPPLPTTYYSGSRNGGPMTASKEICELNRSMWEQFAEDGDSNTQAEIDDRYVVNTNVRSSCWRFGDMDVNVEECADDEEHAAKVMEEAKEDAKMEVNRDIKDDAAVTQKCKKSDGRRWRCSQRVSQSKSLCDYHLGKKRSYDSTTKHGSSSTAATDSTVGTSLKPRKNKKKKKVWGSGDYSIQDFYFYSGFGPSSRKGQSTGSLENFNTIQEAVDEDTHSEGLGGDEFDGEESNDEDDGIDSGGDGEQRGNADGDRSGGRKTVKARSLKTWL